MFACGRAVGVVASGGTGVTIHHARVLAVAALAPSIRLHTSPTEQPSPSVPVVAQSTSRLVAERVPATVTERGGRGLASSRRKE